MINETQLNSAAEILAAELFQKITFVYEISIEVLQKKVRCLLVEPKTGEDETLVIVELDYHEGTVCCYYLKHTSQVFYAKQNPDTNL